MKRSTFRFTTLRSMLGSRYRRRRWTSDDLRRKTMGVQFDMQTRKIS